MHTNVVTKLIPLTRPTLPPFKAFIKDVKKIFDSGMITNGKYVEEFEKLSSNFLSTKYAVAVSSGTSAIIIALLATKIKGEVIVPSFNFSSPVNSLALLGFKPVFADINPDTFNIDLNDAAKKITRNTVGFLIPHVFGNPAEINSISKLAKEANCFIIYDCAHAFGSSYQGKSVSNFGDFAAFSLTATKPLALGEGGLLVIKNAKIYDEARILRNNGDSYNRKAEMIGISARMTEFQGSLGVLGLKFIRRNLANRQILASLYVKLLSQIRGIRAQKIELGSKTTYQSFAIVLADNFPIRRDLLVKKLAEYNIETKPYFSPPVHKKAPYMKKGMKLMHTEDISKRIICLPIYSHMKTDDVYYVVDSIKKIISRL